MPHLPAAPSAAGALAGGHHGVGDLPPGAVCGAGVLRGPAVPGQQLDAGELCGPAGHAGGPGAPGGTRLARGVAHPAGPEDGSQVDPGGSEAAGGPFHQPLPQAAGHGPRQLWGQRGGQLQPLHLSPQLAVISPGTLGQVPAHGLQVLLQTAPVATAGLLGRHPERVEGRAQEPAQPPGAQVPGLGGVAIILGGQRQAVGPHRGRGVAA